MVAETMDCPGPGKTREATYAVQATGPGGHKRSQDPGMQGEKGAWIIAGNLRDFLPNLMF